MTSAVAQIVQKRAALTRRCIAPQVSTNLTASTSSCGVWIFRWDKGRETLLTEAVPATFLLWNEGERLWLPFCAASHLPRRDVGGQVEGEATWWSPEWELSRKLRKRFFPVNVQSWRIDGRDNDFTTPPPTNALGEEITPWKLMKSHKLMRGKLQRRGVSAFSLAFPSSRENCCGQDPYF